MEEHHHSTSVELERISLAFLYIVFSDILLNNIKHLLQAAPGRTQEEKIICVSKTARIKVAEDTSAARLLEKIEEVVHIKAEEYW